MKLIDVIDAAGGRCSGGDPYMWHCYGEHANYMEFRTVAGQGYSHCIYDTKTYMVYEVHAEIPEKDQAFRWLNPKTKDAYLQEATQRKVNPNEAWDEVEYINIDEYDEMLNLLTEIGEGTYQEDEFTMPMPGTIGGAKLIFPEENMNTYMVNLDVRHVLEVSAGSMDEAIEKAKHFQETMPTGWGEHNDFEVSWIDTYVIKESAEREISI